MTTDSATAGVKEKGGSWMRGRPWLIVVFCSGFVFGVSPI